MRKRLGQLIADIAAAQRDRRARLLAARDERLCVVEGLKLVDGMQIRSWNLERSWRASGGDEQSIEWELAAVLGCHHAFLAADARYPCIQQQLHAALLVDLYGTHHHVPHLNPALEKDGQCDAVVERVRLTADESHIRVGVVAADMLGGSGAGDAISHN